LRERGRGQTKKKHQLKGEKRIPLCGRFSGVLWAGGGDESRGVGKSKLERKKGDGKRTKIILLGTKKQEKNGDAKARRSASTPYLRKLSI